MENKDNLLGVIKTLFRWKKQILIVCLLAGIGSVVISLFMDNYYMSVTTFYAASPDQALPEPVGTEVSDRDYYGESEDIDRILTIAESKEIADYLIAKYKLYEHYDIDSTKQLAPFKIKKKFYQLYNVKKTKFDAIEISIEDKDPEMATMMVNDARDKVKQIAQGIIKGTQWQKIGTFQQSMVDKNKELKVIGETLQKLRREYGVYNTETQSEGLADLLARVESSMAREKARRDILKSKPRISRDTIAMMEAMIAGQEQQMVQLNVLMDNFNEGLSEIKVYEEIHEEAREQLSLDKERLKQLQSVYYSDFNTIFLVEKGELPLYKSRPVRSIICLAAVFIAFLLSIFTVLILENYKDVNWREIYKG